MKKTQEQSLGQLPSRHADKMTPPDKIQSEEEYVAEIIHHSDVNTTPVTTASDSTASTQEAVPLALQFSPDFHEKLQSKLENLYSKQTNKVTESVFDSAIEATRAVVDSNDFPRNSHVELSGSADKKTSWLEESRHDVKVVKPNGAPLDLQILKEQADRPILNLESELHGNKERNKDFKKIKGHDPMADVNVLVYRDKSMKNIDKNMSSLVKSTSGTKENITLTSIYCPHNKKFSESKVTTVVANNGKKIWDSRDDDSEI